MHNTCTLALVVTLASFSTVKVVAQDNASKPEAFESLLRRGFTFHSEQQYSRSIPLLEQAHALRPSDYQVNLLLGIDYLRTGNTAKSVTFLRSAHKANDRDAVVLGYLAEAYSFLEEYDQAAEMLRLATSVEASSQTNMGLVRFNLRRFRTLAEELRSTRIGLAYAYRLQALALRARADPEELGVLLKIQELWPEFPGLDNAFGHLQLAQGDFEHAKASFVKARRLSPHDLELLSGEAVLAVHSGDQGEAERLLSEINSRSRHQFLRALQNWPDSVSLPPNLKNRVVATSNAGPALNLNPSDLFRQQRWEVLTQVLIAKAGSPEECRWLGVALANLERFEEAIPILERARKDTRSKLECDYWLSFCYAKDVERVIGSLPRTGPESALAHLARAEILLRLAWKGTAASEEYRQALAITPSDPAIWTGLAEAQLLSGAPEEARRSARKALELDPHRLMAARIVAEASIRQRDYSPAIPALQQVLAAQPHDVDAQVLIGTAYSKLGEDQQALHWLETALREGYRDEKGTTHYLLGTVLRRLGRVPEAEEALKQAEALSESFSRAPHAQAQGQEGR